MLQPSDQFMLLNRCIQPFPDVIPDHSRLFKMAGIVRFRPFLHDVMTLGIIKPSGSFKTQMHFGTSFNALFFQRPAVNEAPFKAMLSHMFVVLHLPAFSQFPQLLFLLSGGQVSGILFRPSPIGIPGVIAPEILFRCTFNAIIHTLAHHNMRMRLFAAVNARFRIVNGKTPGVPFASFLTYKILHQFKALFRCQFTG